MKVIISNNETPYGPCHLWIAATNKAGYGIFGENKTSVLAHRWAYKHWIGPIPQGLHLDHFVCSTPNCVNPLHVRPVTPRENSLRSDTSLAAQGASATHCPFGHPYDETNTGYIKQGRYCRECHNRRNRERRKRLRAEKTHCKRGHPLSGDNAIFYSDGRVGCRSCMSSNGKLGATKHHSS